METLTVTCRQCNYWDEFESEAIAEAAAVFHAMERGHAVSCYRPGPVLVFCLTVEQAALISLGVRPEGK